LNIDLASTILGAANLPPHERMQGRDIADLYMKSDAKETWRKEFFYQHQSMGMHYIPASSALVRKDYKYMIYPEWKVEQLFDMINDPLEINDIVNRSEYSALVDEMRKRHDELAEEVK
jgi:arylsulfatase A-like enzyme